MKLKKICQISALLMLNLSYVPISSSEDFGANVTEQRFKKADVVIVQMNDIRASVFTFYDENSALPSSMGVLTNPAYIFYTGNLVSAFGTTFTGTMSGDGRFFNVTVDLKSAEIAAYTAQRLNTQPSGTSVTLSIGTPASSIVDNGFLARNFDAARPELNEMNTDMSLGGNNINNVDILNASRINISDLATIDQLNVIDTTTTLDLTSTGTSTLNIVNVSGDATLNRTTTNGPLTINGGVAFNSTSAFNDVANFNSAANIIGLLT
ncbi:MAG: hypothetical protein QMC38_05505, partial [Sinobacterium sp.]